LGFFLKCFGLRVLHIEFVFKIATGKRQKRDGIAVNTEGWICPIDSWSWE